MYEIFADVSIDIDPAFAEKYQVKYVPMEYMIGDEARHCESPESLDYMHLYYDKLRNGIPTRTSQITPYQYAEIFRPYVEAGTPLLYLSLSSGLSDTYQSALMAVNLLKEDYDNVEIEVVDSLAATIGMGILTESACLNREAGMSLKENADWLRANLLRVQHWFKVEDLMYLKRGGRISAATAIVGSALNIKPILMIDAKGRLETIAKKRGSKLAMKHLIELFCADYNPSISKRVYICCSDCLADAELLKKMVLSEHPEAQVCITSLSPIIGAHTGPDMIAIVYYGNPRG